MISFFKKNRKGIGSKIILFVLVLLMLPFGVDLLSGGGGIQSGNIAEVDSTEISTTTYARELSQLENALRAQFGENYEMVMQAIDIKKQVLDNLIHQILLTSFIDASELAVGIGHVKSFVESLPLFQGGATAEKYQAFLDAQGMSESQFINEVSARLASEQLESILGLAAYVPPLLAKEHMVLADRKAAFHYVEVQPGEVSVSPDMVTEYYNAHAARFLSKRKVRLLTLTMPVSKSYNEVPIDEQDIADAYQRLKYDYAVPALARVRRAEFAGGEGLFPGSESGKDNLETQVKLAEELIEQYLPGQSFENLAREKGAIVTEDATLTEQPKEVQMAIQKIAVGELSAPLTVGSTVMVVEVLEKQEAGFKKIGDIRDELRERIQKEIAPQIARIHIQEIEARLEGMPLEDVGEEMEQLAVREQLQFVKQEELSSERGDAQVSDSGWQKALAGGKGDFFLDEQDDVLRLVYVADVEEPQTLPLEKVTDQISAILIAQARTDNAKEAAKERIASLQENLTASADVDVVFPESYGDIATTELAALGEVRFPFPVDPESVERTIAQALLKGVAAQPLVASDGKVYLVSRANVDQPSLEAVSGKYSEFVSAQSKNIGVALRTRLIEELKANASITVHDEVLSSFR